MPTFPRPLFAAITALLAMSFVSGCSSAPLGFSGADEDVEVREESMATSQSALPARPLPRNDVDPNPYMSSSEGSVHNDCYSSDVTDAVLPLGIDSTVSLSLETENVTAPSAAFYDEFGNAVTPLLGGISIVRMDGDVIERLGSFVPSIHDGGGYSVQISYSFVDADNNVVMPTTDGRIICVRTVDEAGNVLPTFEKVFDIDVVSQAKAVLGEDVDPNILSIVYDYDGNLWFVTGGFRIYPDRNPAGFLGYIPRGFIESASRGELPSEDDAIEFMRLSEGEGAENGISSCREGAVILTNKACYLLRAGDGVEQAWSVPYESNGANDAVSDSGYSGGGLSYGSGTTPTLTKDLVLFTDNLDPVNLIAVSVRSGEVAAKAPVFSDLGPDVPVAVENSILVYDSGSGTTSVVLANWFGAGNAGLASPDSDSTVQSYDNIYDAKWREEGNSCIAPGLERIDIVKGDEGYAASSVWMRSDVRSTAMAKLSTATGYLYGYWQDDAGQWCYTVLDFNTGKTLLEQPVSSLSAYNNVAVGMIPDPSGNALYCPTNGMEMARWQDDFASLPEIPAKDIDPSEACRERMTDEEFASMSGCGLSVRSYAMEASVPHVPQDGVLFSFKANGISGQASALRLFAKDASGALREFDGEWSLVDPSGETVSGSVELDHRTTYEVRPRVSDGSVWDLDATQFAYRVSVVLASEG